MHRRLHAVALAALLLSAVPASRAQTIDEQGLLAYYPLEFNARDSGTGHYDGTIAGGPLESDPDGVHGRSLALDGVDDAISFAALPDPYAENFAFAWNMRTADLAPRVWLGKRAGCTNSNYFEVRQDPAAPDQLVVELGTGTGAPIQARGTIAANAWTHVAFVRENDTARLYIDGGLAQAVAIPSFVPGNNAAPFSIGASPCIGTGGLLRPKGDIDDLRVYNRELTDMEVAELAREPNLLLSPSTAVAGDPIAITASGIVAGRLYRVYAVDGSTEQEVPLGSAIATSNTLRWQATVPSVPIEQGRVSLRAETEFYGLIECDAVLDTTVPLGVDVTTSAPRAGKPMHVDVDGLAGGAVRLRYGDRVIAGPVPVDGTSASFDVAVPVGYPATFPAQVIVRAEQLAGRNVVRSGTTTITVAAPSSSPFVQAQGLVVDRPAARPGDTVRIDGHFDFGDDTTSADVRTSAFWVANGSGRITPLPTRALALASDGTFRLDTFPPSLGAMTSFIPAGPGRLRLVIERIGPFGRPETQIVDGPDLTTTFDSDPQTDITITVLKGGTQETVPLVGAYVVLDGNAPVQPYELPPDDGESGFSTSGLSWVGNTQPNFDFASGGRPAVNQVGDAIDDTVQLPPPVCGSSLYRRYTNAEGKAEFLLQGGPQEPPQSFQLVGAARYRASNCTSDGCANTVQLPYKFDLTVYTLHRGAGYRPTSGGSNTEIPSRFEIEYARDTGTFTIRNVRTGAVTVQNTSANIELVVPPITGSQNYLTINDPIMFQQVGTKVSAVPRIGDKGYGKWIEFTTANVDEFVNEAPVKVIRFAHKPSVNGSIDSAKLYLPNNQTGQPNVVGTFNQTAFVEGCNIQDDGTMSGSEQWELRLDNTLASSWRFPRGVWFRSDAAEPKACGYIEVTNTSGAVGRRNICFEWQPEPSYFAEDNGRLVVDDSDMARVLVQSSGASIGDSSVHTPNPGPVLGEPVEKPRATSSRSKSGRGLFDTVTASGPGGAVRRLAGDNPEQFNEGAAGAETTTSFGSGETQIEIGEDRFNNILDATIPLFQWYWGVPEILSVEVYARLRLIAAYYFHGFLTKDEAGEHLDMVNDALFAAIVYVGVDVDVLFGVIVDAGATLFGTVQSEIPIVVADNEPQEIEPCITFKLDFYGYVDPCPLCPTPVIEFNENIIDAQDPPNCSFFDGRPAGSGFVANALQGGGPQFGSDEARYLRRHPAVDFDPAGNGQVLSLAADGSLRATFVQGSQAFDTSTLSVAPGTRQAKVVYYKPNRAISVWLESALTNQAFQAGSYPTIAQNQRLAYATYDGHHWSAKSIITPPGTGEAHPALVACFAGKPGCPANGEVLLAWQRNESGSTTNPKYRIRFATWRPGTGWGALGSADTSAPTNVEDITPTAAYVGGKPFIAWVRQLGTNLNRFDLRRLAYRHVGEGGVQVAGTTVLPDAPVAPSIVAAPVASPFDVLLAFVRPEDDEGPVGTSLALHIAAGQCSAGECAWNWHKARDPIGRAIFGERPQVLRVFGDAVSIVMRGFRFEGEDGEPVQAGDTIGSVISSGDLLSLQPNFANGVVRTLAISADGAMHFGQVAAYDAGTQSVVTLASTLVPDGNLPMRAILEATGPKGQRAYGAVRGNFGGVEMRGLASAPDFVIESFTGDAGVNAGANVATQLRIGNRGNDYVAARDGAVRLELRFDSPAAAPVASIALADLAGGDALELEPAFDAPANAYADEPHVLYASIVPAAGFSEVSGDGNDAELAFAALPVPRNIATQIRPGATVVQLGWEAPDDARVAGYRVYRLAEDGATWLPLGASESPGFLDLSAQFLVPRTYAITSYSARGIESERSKPVTAMPVQPERDDIELFRDGFEDGAR